MRSGTSEPEYRDILRKAGVNEDVIATVDDDYRALGRFHYEFSRVIFNMRFAVRFRKSFLSGTGQAEADAAEVLDDLTWKTAGTAGTKFFKYCQEVFPHSEDDLVIAQALKEEFESFNTIRNHLSHGDLSIGWGSSGRIAPPETYRWGAKNPPEHRIEYDGPSNLDKLADQIAYHKRRLGHYADICLAPSPDLTGQSGASPSNQLCIRNERVELVRPHPPERDVHILA